MLSKITRRIEQNTKEESTADKETIFFEEACQFIKQLQRQEEERINKLERTSYKMLTGEKNVTARTLIIVKNIIRKKRLV